MKEPPLDPIAIQECVRLLESLVEDRTRLKELPTEQRKALLMAAGRVSRPERLEMIRLTKKHRRDVKKKLNQADRLARAQTGIRQARQQTIYLPPAKTTTTSRPAVGQLYRPRQCYVCKIAFTELHFFYDSMCLQCGDLNYEKRFQTAPLDGQVALLTGARLKIGYQAALKLLQAGCTVVVTTRFARDAAARFAREGDYSSWANRLFIHGLDLRHSPSVELFCRMFEDHYGRLDILINNAAQTVRRPPGFYAHLLEREKVSVESLPPNEQRLLQVHEQHKSQLGGSPAVPVGGHWMQVLQDPRPGIGIRQSALLSQIPYHFEDGQFAAFPEGQLDADLQQVDLRRNNTWRLRLGEITTAEMLEVHLINSVAPFILCSRLREVMTRQPTFRKHIVNVSAMEGKFNRFTKTDKHPHTNMAKAALNMLTLTSAPDLAKQGVYMNAVDTGWVTDEDPIHHSQNKQAEHDFHPPLDIVDGAARVLDPIFHQALTGQAVWGKFLKDYRPTAW